jgi:thiosulfate/3-mercaptopyruvate sulfurtransferase
MFNQNKSFKSLEEMQGIFESVGALEDATGQPVVTSCQSGVTSCVLFTALESLGNKNVRNYDGSYSDYLYQSSKAK